MSSAPRPWSEWPTLFRIVAPLLLLLLAASHLEASDTLRRYQPYITSAEAGAKKVLRTARSMVRKREIIRGSCWNWLDTAYRRAGFPRGKRSVVFAGTKKGPYARLSHLRPGDWIYHINHSYGGIEHSGMFIRWYDRGRNRALMLSYGGEGRRQPGRYRVYDITHTYRIIRPKE